eukprot:scaffold1261_cov377-Prasinococcus_capsulatus_cf.AAC.4
MPSPHRHRVRRARRRGWRGRPLFGARSTGGGEEGWGAASTKGRARAAPVDASPGSWRRPGRPVPPYPTYKCPAGPG